MDQHILPAKSITGGLRLPGDKSISHRYALLGAVAEGETTIRNFAPGSDCASTLGCLEQLGVGIARRRVATETGETTEEIVMEGRGLRGLQAPQEKLDAGNSGSTMRMRMVSGLLAGHSFRSVLTGDESLRRRPMKRIIEPLERSGGVRALVPESRRAGLGRGSSIWPACMSRALASPRTWCRLTLGSRSPESKRERRPPSKSATSLLSN